MIRRALTPLLLATAALGCAPVPGLVGAVTIEDVQLSRALLDGEEVIQGSFHLTLTADPTSSSAARAVLNEPRVWAQDDTGRDLFSPQYSTRTAAADTPDPIVVPPGGAGTTRVTFTAARGDTSGTIPPVEVTMTIGGRVTDEGDNDLSYEAQVPAPPPL